MEPTTVDMVPIAPIAQVSQDAFDKTIGELKAQFGGLASKEAITELQAKIQQLFDAVTRMDGNIKTEIAELDARLVKEHDERVADVAAVRSQVETVSTTTEQKLHDIDSKIDTGLSNIQSGIANITGKLESWQMAMDAQRDLHRQQKEDLDRQRGVISEIKKTQQLVVSNQSTVNDKVIELTTALYGGRDDRKSIIGMIEETQATISAGFLKQSDAITKLSSAAEAQAAKVDALQKEMDEQKRKVERWKEAAVSTMSKVLGSRMFWIALGTGIMTVGPNVIVWVEQILATFK